MIHRSLQRTTSYVRVLDKLKDTSKANAEISLNPVNPVGQTEHTPTCPEDPDEKDIRRRTVSKIRQDVERELENADRVLSQADGFPGSRTQSRAGNIRTRGDSNGKDVNKVEGYGASGQGKSNSGPKAEECPRSVGHSIADISNGGRGTGYGTRDHGYEDGGGAYGQFRRENAGAPGDSYGGPGGPYGPDGGGHGGSGGPYGRAGGGHGGPGGPYGADGAGYGGPGGPYETAGGGHGGPGGPYGADGAGYGGPGGPYETAGGGHGGPGGPYGTAGGGHGGPGGPYGTAGGGHGGPGGPYGTAGGGHGGPGGPYGADGTGRGGPNSSYGADGTGHGRSGSPFGADGTGHGGPGGPYGTAGGGHGGPGGPYGTAGGGHGGPGGPYGTAGGGHGGPGGPYGTAGGGHGGPGGPYGADGTGRGGPDSSYGADGTGHGRSGSPFGADGTGHGGPDGPYGPDGTGHGGPDGPNGPDGTGHGGPGGPYGADGAGHGGSGGPYGRAGGGHGGPGGPYGADGAGYGGPGGPYETAGGGHGGPGGPYGADRAGFGRSGSPYGADGAGYGGPNNRYSGTGGAGTGHGPLESYAQDGDPYAAAKSPGSPGSTAKSRDPSRTGYNQGRTASGMTFGATSPAAVDGRGKSPPSVHYSPSTALSSRAGNLYTGNVSETRSVVNEGRSPTGIQFSSLRGQSPTGFESSGHERGVSPTGTHYSGSKGISDVMGAGLDVIGAGLDVMGYEGPGSRHSPIGGSRGSPGRSSRGGSPTDGSRGTFGTGPKDQSVTNNKMCPAAMHGKCPAFARDSSPTEPSKAGLVATSSSKRPLSRIEEGPSSEEMTGNEPHGQHSCFPEEDFSSPSGGTRSRMQSSREGFTTCSTGIPVRPRCEGTGQLMYDSAVSDRFQNIAPRPQPFGYGQPSTHSRVPDPTHEYHHHDHHDHDGEGFRGKPVHPRDEKAISALSHLSQIPKTPSYLRCKPDRGLEFSSCDKSYKETPKMVKFPEKPCKGIEEIQEMINCEKQDVDSVWYLTSDEKKTYKKPCPKQQKAQENVKSIVKPQTPQTCPKEYTPLEHPDPDDITPELAASMMFSQEQGIKLNECPDETIKRFFPDVPRPPFPVKLSAVHIVDSNQEDQEEMIEKSASVPSEGVSDSAYTRRMQNKGDMGAQKSYDIDFAVGAEKREYVLVAEKPQRYNKVQFRGNLPSWFPGYMQTFPDDADGMKLVTSPSEVFQKAWTNSSPENIPSSDVVVLE